MTKKLLLICLTILFNCQTKKDKSDDPIITIYSVDKDIETIISIQCSEFLNQFDGTEFKTKKLTEKRTVDYFLHQLEDLGLASDKRDPDTRGMILIKTKTATDTICADKFSLRYRNKYYLMSDKLRKEIWTE